MQHRCAFVASLLSFSANLAFSAKTGIITIEGQEGRPVDKPARTEEEERNMEENEIEKAEPNRNRSRQVKFWVSEEEYELLQKKREAAGGVNQGAYIRKMVLDGYIVNLDIPELKEIIRLLSITSNNVNQMARQLNSNNTIYPQELTEVEAQLEQIYKLLRKVMRGISKIK